jgi:hypothetical protein
MIAIDRRAPSRRNFEWPGEIVFGYAGIGIAMLTLIESTVRVTIRHSDSEPIASEAATASASRDEATSADGLSKPVAPDDRIMAEILQCAGESPTASGDYPGIAGNIAAAPGLKMAKWRRDRLSQRRSLIQQD